MPAHLLALAKRFDERRALENEANFDESKHPRANDGKFSSTGGGGATPKGDGSESVRQKSGKYKVAAETFARFMGAQKSRADIVSGLNGMLQQGRRGVRAGGESAAAGIAERKAAHRVAIQMGFKYNSRLRKYE